MSAEGEGAGWRLGERRGEGLVAGLRALWRQAAVHGIDGAGEAAGPIDSLALDSGQLVAVALRPHDNSALLRLRGFLDGAKGVVLLENLARAHARLLSQRDPLTSNDIDPSTESHALLTLASLIDDADALLRAYKPGH